MASPTAALLLAACRPHPLVDDVRAAVKAGADLDEAASLAVAQRVSPLLWRSLRMAELADDTTSWGPPLNAHSTSCTPPIPHLLPRIGERGLAPLAAAGIPPLVIKGGALAGRYPELGLRPMDDIDLVLPEDQIDAAVDVLLAAGWTRHETPARVTHEIPLSHPALPGMQIDLHRRLGSWRHRSSRMTTNDLWAERQPTELFGAPAFVLPRELEFVMLAAHAGKPWHAFDRLIWVVDLVVVNDEGELDWQRIASDAARFSSETAVAVALSLASRLGMESPAAMRRIAPRWRSHALAQLLSDDWPTTVYDRESRALSRYALVDARAARLRLMAGELVTTTWGGPTRRAYRLAKRTLRQRVDRRRARLS
jgi:hypothetical protein